MNEFTFIASLLSPLAAAEKGALGLKDDAAVLDVPSGHELVITKDALIAGVHFIGNEPTQLIARKALHVNLSDLAAMGAKPWGYFLALMLPAEAGESWLKDFAQGLEAVQTEYGIILMGGDTTRAPGQLAISVTVLGLVPKGAALKRGGASVGDIIYVSGTLGDAALGLKVAQGKRDEPNSFLLDRYRLPQPRVKLGQALRGIAAACMDISDGLMQDLGHLCAVSQVGAEIRWQDIPLSPEAREMLVQLKSPYEPVLAGGDDYELLFTVPPAKEAALLEAVKSLDVAVTRIGVVTKGRGAKALDEQGAEILLPHAGYQHF